MKFRSLLQASWLLLVYVREVRPWALPHYFVIGQQKCGTSTLWNLASMHPQLAKGTTGWSKEIVYFQETVPYSIKTASSSESAFERYGVFNERCDRDLKKYIENWADQEEGHLAGDFSATQLSCHCCPELIHNIQPSAKIIVLLREPVARSLSRFTAQYNWLSNHPSLSLSHVGVWARQSGTLEKFGDDMMRRINECLEQVRVVMTATGGGSQGLQQTMEHRCLVSDTVVGWSAYSIFLRRWLEFFPKEQLLVLYTEDLERDPLAVMRKVERFLGVVPYDYEVEKLHAKFNTEHSYGWDRSKQIRGEGSSWKHAGSHSRAHQFRRNESLVPSSLIRGNLSKLHTFLRPYLMELEEMGNRGLIEPVSERLMTAFYNWTFQAWEQQGASTIPEDDMRAGTLDVNNGTAVPNGLVESEVVRKAIPVVHHG